MSQENVEIVRSIYDAFNHRDWDALFRDSHPETELILPPGLNRSTYSVAAFEKLLRLGGGRLKCREHLLPIGLNFLAGPIAPPP